MILLHSGFVYCPKVAYLNMIMLYHDEAAFTHHLSIFLEPGAENGAFLVLHCEKLYHLSIETCILTNFLSSWKKYLGSAVHYAVGLI